METFVALAEPTRRRILDELRGAERSVGELVSRLDVAQPTVSKHLRVLRESGMVSSRVDAQHRRYRLEPAALADVDRWLAPYRALWSGALDRLERSLDGRQGEAGR
jgi:DNA-binding transcriptional ArsR family regulator